MSVISPIGTNEPQTQVNSATPVTPYTPISGAGLSGNSSGVSTSSDYGSIFLNRRTLENLGLPAIDNNIDNINLKTVAVALATLIDKLSALASKSAIQGASDEIQTALSALSEYEASVTLVKTKGTELADADDALVSALTGLTQTVSGTATFDQGSLTSDSTADQVQLLLSNTDNQLTLKTASLAALQSDLLTLQTEVASLREQLDLENAKPNPNSQTIANLENSISTKTALISEKNTAISATQASIVRLQGDKEALTTLQPYYTTRDLAKVAYETALEDSDQLQIASIQALATAAISISKSENKNSTVVSADNATLDAIDELIADIKDAAKRRALEGVLKAIVDAAASRSESGTDKPGAGILSERRSDGAYSTVTRGGLAALLALNPASMTLDNFLKAVNTGGSTSRLKGASDAIASLDELTKKKVVADVADFLNRLKAAVDAIKSVTDLIAAANKQDEPIVKVSL